MNALIGDRFLKRLLGHRLHRYWASPAGESLTQPEPASEKPAEPEGPPTDGLPETDALLENEKPGEINQLAVPVNGSDQPATDKNLLTSDCS